ncbi:hypothetical protein [Nitrincola sp.]|uniref:hypothetical protein n=1 Tax=Nitrincola sp. TaxID=1926584 RepID=UPI003A93EA94
MSLCIPSFCHDTDTAHSAAQKQDADRLLRQVEAERAIKEQTFKMVATFTNEAYRSRFQQEPQPLKGLCPAGANCIADPSRIIYSHAAEDDIKNVEPGSIQAVNGILHDQRHRVSEQNYLHPQQDCFRPFLRAT